MGDHTGYLLGSSNCSSQQAQQTGTPVQNVHHWMPSPGPRTAGVISSGGRSLRQPFR